MSSKFGAKLQYAEVTVDSLLLDKFGKRFIQAVEGTFLLYDHAVNSNIASGIEHNCDAVNEANKRHNAKSRSFLRLLCTARRNIPYIQSELCEHHRQCIWMHKAEHVGILISSSHFPQNNKWPSSTSLQNATGVADAHKNFGAVGTWQVLLCKGVLD